MSGVLPVDKPVGPTSMEVVARVRRLAGGVRTGHAGTLDPLASGVLILLLGPATRGAGRLMDTPKRYDTTIDLSSFTDTDDLEGAPKAVEVAAPPAAHVVAGALVRFTGSVRQRPPAYSAVKLGGRRAYALARRGAAPELAERRVRVHRIDLIEYRWPLLRIDLWCDKGFYVRSLARDLGVALGTGGHCRVIRRTAVGPFTVEGAVAFDSLIEPLKAVDLIPLPAALARLDAGSGGPIPFT
jgi:tRNA pseudouridine55 synthase